VLYDFERRHNVEGAVGHRPWSILDRMDVEHTIGIAFASAFDGTLRNVHTYGSQSASLGIGDEVSITTPCIEEAGGTFSDAFD
jgi:hypothetical protein